jgi:hypothetical protein
MTLSSGHAQKIKITSVAHVRLHNSEQSRGSVLRGEVRSVKNALEHYGRISGPHRF